MSNYSQTASTKSVYIHWPFCPYRCFYCPFIALAGQDQYMEQYHNALIKEIEISKEIGLDISIDTLYLGGGTPSTYPAPLLLDTFDILRKRFGFLSNAEITIEVNPGTVTNEKMQAWKEIGINRVSIGVQSFNEKTLRSVNRLQTVSQVKNLLNSIFSYVETVSVDVILGLPGVTAAEWKSMLQELVSFPISHISLYILEVHDHTQLFYKVRSGELVLPNEEELIELFYWSRDFLHASGFMHYELSNFARFGRYSRHNTCYWERKPFKGFGLGAWSFDGINRIQNEKNLLEYCKKVGSDHIEIVVEQVSPSQARIEKIMLGLRRKEGVAYETVVTGKKEAQEEKRRAIDALVAQGLIEQSADNQLVLTVKGLILENKIASYLS